MPWRKIHHSKAEAMVSHVALGVTNQPRSCHTSQANMALAWDLLTVTAIASYFIEVRGKDDTFVFSTEVAKIIIAILVNNSNGHPTNRLSGNASQVENARTSTLYIPICSSIFLSLIRERKRSVCRVAKRNQGAVMPFPVCTTNRSVMDRTPPMSQQA